MSETDEHAALRKGSSSRDSNERERCSSEIGFVETWLLCAALAVLELPL